MTSGVFRLLPEGDPASGMAPSDITSPEQFPGKTRIEVEKKTIVVYEIEGKGKELLVFPTGVVHEQEEEDTHEGEHEHEDEGEDEDGEDDD